MRVTHEEPRAPGRPDAAVPTSNGAHALGFIRGAIRNSPWIVIAVTAHVIALAV